MQPDDVLGTFIGRENLLEKLILHLREQKGTRQPKHVFLHGSRGMGKTTMLLVLRYTIEKDPGLSEIFDIVQFSEEERRVINLPSFAIRVFELLAEKRPEIKKDLEKAKSDPKKALDILLDTASRSNRQAILLIDNFDELIVSVTSAKTRRADTSKKELTREMKHFLSSPSFIIIATSIQPPEKRKNLPQELLSFFDPVIQLESLDDAMGFIRKRAEKDKRIGFLEQIPDFASRIDGLNRLANGNPRLLVFLYDCLGQKPLQDLVEIVQHAVDNLTPMYQDVIDRLLNRGQAAVLEMLSVKGGVGTVEEIAQLTYQDENTVRTFLNDLCNLGFVTRRIEGIPIKEEETVARPVVYRTDPPLFQIWYEMRNLKREVSLYLVRFFCLLTGKEEAKGVLSELRKERKDSQVRLVSLMTDVADILDPDWGEIRKECVDSILEKRGTLVDALKALDQAYSEEKNQYSTRKIGILSIRSEVKFSIGDLKGAESDIDLAESIIPSSAPPETRVKFLIFKSSLLEDLSKYKEALNIAEKALDLSYNLSIENAKEIQASALIQIATNYYWISDYSSAKEKAEKALNLIDEKSSWRIKTLDLNILGLIETSLSNYKDAIVHYDKALQISIDNKDRLFEFAYLNNLGMVYHSMGDFQKSIEFYSKSLSISQEIGDRKSEIPTLGNLGTVYASLGDLNKSIEFYSKSLSISQEINDRLNEGRALNNLGSVYRSLGNFQRSLEYFHKSLIISQEIGDRVTEATTLNNLGSFYGSLGEFQLSLEYYHKSLSIAQEIGDREGEATILRNIGALIFQQGNFLDSLQYFRKSREISLLIGNKSFIGKSSTQIIGSLFALSRSEMIKKDFTKSFFYFSESLEILQEANANEVFKYFINLMIIPCLRESLGFAERLSPLFETLKSREELKKLEQEIKILETLFQYYESGKKLSAFNSLGPTQIFLIRTLVDKIERPEHAMALALTLSGNFVEARKILENILKKNPEDTSSRLNLVSILTKLNELDTAEKELKYILERKKNFSPALMELSEVEKRRGRNDNAIQILQNLVQNDPSHLEAYPELAKLLESENRFHELIDILLKWREKADVSTQKNLKVWIPKAFVLSGNLEAAKKEMPPENFVPDDRSSRVLLELLHVFLALHEMDPDKARDRAKKSLEFIINLPPGEKLISEKFNLLEFAEKFLGEKEYEFFSHLIQAVNLRTHPSHFASQYLSAEEAKELVRLVTEEEDLALKAFDKGFIQGFQDILRAASRKISPCSAIKVLGDQYKDLPERKRSIVLNIFMEALKQGAAAEITASLSALGQNFPYFNTQNKDLALDAILDFAASSQAERKNRFQAVEILNILYPNLNKEDRGKTRSSLEKIRKELESPEILEFFNKTAPQADKEANK